MQEYVLERLYKGYAIESYVFDEKHQLIWSRDAVAEEKKQFLQETEKLFWQECRQKNKPYITTIAENIYVWGIWTYENRICLFGPVGGKTLQNAQIRSFCFHHKLKYEHLHIPRLSIDELFFLMCTTNYMLTGEQITEEEILKENSNIENQWMESRMNYQIYQYEESKSMTSYEDEQHWMEMIEEGRLGIGPDNAINVGTMAKDSDYKQQEYMTVLGVGLATRAAIRGGVPPFLCYETSDLLLQKISKCRKLEEVIEIGSQAPLIFSNLVAEHKKKNHAGILVEQCKDYIAKHLYRSFTVEQMAEELNVNRSHMTRKFKAQTGKSVQEYIVEERLRMAANLLKYSNKSVGQVAEYMQFHNYGRFSRYFKEKYGMTPLKYRELNKTIEFTEKKTVTTGMKMQQKG